MDQELIVKIWEEIIRGLSQVLSRNMSEETEETLEEPQSG
jgi:hypothetical protein